jgi:Pvc16 N-terminal domain
VIDDLDRSVELLLRRELSPGLIEQVGISFAAPDSEFPPSSVTLPAVDLFLYDIRENLELRSPGWAIEHRSDGTAVRRRNPVRVDCSYLITAWASDGSPTRTIDEHRLLSQVMSALLKHPTIPDVLLQGALKSQQPPLPSSTLQPGRLQSVSEFWQALGGKPKAALNYTVTIGVFPYRDEETEKLVTDKTTMLRSGVA